MAFFLRYYNTITVDDAYFKLNQFIVSSLWDNSFHVFKIDSNSATFLYPNISAATSR